MTTLNKADPEWDLHKATIESLYVEDNLKLEGTGQLMDTMVNEYGFSKKKSQYETHFKIWGTRKYRRKDEWKSIGPNIAERKRAGKESNVYSNGKLIPRAKVQKETRRHGFVTALERSRPAPIPPIPDGFEIRTPPAEVVPLTAILGDTPSLPVGTETRGCASSQLQIVSSALPSQTVTSDASLDVLRNLMTPSPLTVPTDLSPVQGYKAITPTLYSPGMYESCGFVFEEVDEALRPLKLISNLPFCQLEDRLLAQIEPSVISADAQMFGFKSTSESISLPEYHQNNFNKDIDVLHKALKGSHSLTANIKALLPSAVRVSQEKDQIVLSPNYDRSDTSHYKLFSLLIFAIANDFAGLNSVAIEETMNFLSRHASTRLLQHILKTSGPESEAFAEKLFQAAILMEDASIIKVLLQKGLVPNDLVCVHRGAKYTPLEYSSMVWNVEITRLLLDAKVDVNKSIEGDKGSGGALARALIGQWHDYGQSHVPIPSEIVHMLLEAGGKISWLETATWRLQDNQEVLDLLLDHAFKTKTYDQAWYRLASDIMEICDNATATRTVRRFLKAGANIEIIEHETRFPMFDRPFRNPIDVAAERGNFESVQLLLRSPVSSTRETLTCAIRSRNKELIKFLLNDGADVSAFEESTVEHRYNSERVPSPVPSPLSEAIRWGDAEILDLLRRNGVWSRTVNKVTEIREFEDVLIAASVRGELNTVRELLNYRPPNTFGVDLSDALVAAIYLNDDAIALTLFDAGANVNGGSYKAPDIDAVGKEGFDSASSIDTGTNEDFRECSHRGPALVEALLQKNEHQVRLILDSDVYFHSVEGKPSIDNALEAAVEWGSIPIIEELISMGIPMPSNAVQLSIKKGDNECTQLLVKAGADTTSALIFAVTNNDIELVEYLFSIGADPANSKALLEAEALPDGLPMIERLLTEFVRSYPRGAFGYGRDTFLRAIRKGNFTLVKLLLDNAKIVVKSAYDLEGLCDNFEDDEWDLRCDAKTLLGEAIAHTTSFAIIERLLNEVGNPNVLVQKFRASPGLPYERKQTALLVAIDTKDIHKVQLLVDAGANVNWPATKGIKRTPIQKAAEIGSYAITQLLIKERGLVNNEPAIRGGATALQLAAIGGYIGIAELLLDNGAHVNAPPAKVYGRTALEGAAEHGRIDMLKLLCNAGAEFQGTEYEKARELAKNNGHMATWRYLETLYPSCEMTSMDFSHNL